MDLVNEEDIDDMHHALGRPAGPEIPYWRNSFCTEVGSAKYNRFLELGYWTLERTINEGRDAVFHVNEAGKAAVWAWKSRGTPLSALSGRPGHPGYESFKRIAASWGYD